MRKILNIVMIFILGISLISPIAGNAKSVDVSPHKISRITPPPIVWENNYGHGWVDTASTADGDIIAVSTDKNIMSIDPTIDPTVSSNINWGPVDMGHAWQAVTYSESSDAIIAVANDGYIVSLDPITGNPNLGPTNYGSKYWRGVTSTLDGNIIAVAYFGAYAVSIDPSIDSGADDGSPDNINWGPISYGSDKWVSAAITPDGDAVLAGYDGRILSIDPTVDSGPDDGTPDNINWGPVNYGSHYWTSAISTFTGDVVLVDAYGLIMSINPSIDPGSTWTNNVNWGSVKYTSTSFYDSVLTSDGDIIASSNTGNVVSFDPRVDPGVDDGSPDNTNWGPTNYGAHSFDTVTTTTTGDLIIGASDGTIMKLGSHVDSNDVDFINEESYARPTSDQDLFDDILTTFNVQVIDEVSSTEITYSNLYTDDLFSFGIDTDGDVNDNITVYGKDGATLSLDNIYKIIHTPGIYKFVFEYDFPTSGLNSFSSMIEIKNIQNTISTTNDEYDVYVGQTLLTDAQYISAFGASVTGVDDYNSDGTNTLYSNLTVTKDSSLPTSGTYTTVDDYDITFSYNDDGEALVNTDDDTDKAVASKKVTLHVKEPPFSNVSKTVTDSTDAGATAQPGETLHYTISATNGATAQDITITDPVNDANLDATSVTNITATGAADNTPMNTKDIDYTFASVAPNTTVSVSFDVNVKSAIDTTLTSINNTASIEGTSATMSANASINLDYASENNINVTKSVSKINNNAYTSTDKVVPTDKITYQVELDNDKAMDQSAVVVTDTPDSVDVNSIISVKVYTDSSLSTELAASAYTVDAATNTITINTLPANTKYYVVYTVSLDGTNWSNDTKVENSVSVESSTITTPKTSNASVDKDTTTKADDISISKTVSDSADTDSKAGLGEELTYKITIKNEGYNTQSNVRVVDALDDEYLDLSSASVSYDTAPNTDNSNRTDGLDVTYNTLAPSEERIITITINTKATFTRLVKLFITNSASVQSNSITTPVSDTVRIGVDFSGAASGVSLNKEITNRLTADNDLKADSGETINYEITLTTTDYAQNNVEITDSPDNNVDASKVGDEVASVSLATTNPVNITTGGVTTPVASSDYTVINNSDGSYTLTMLMEVPANSTLTVDYEIELNSNFEDANKIENIASVTSTEIGLSGSSVATAGTNIAKDVNTMPTINATDAIIQIGTDVSTLTASVTFNATSTSYTGDTLTTSISDISSVPVDASGLANKVGVYDVEISATDTNAPGDTNSVTVQLVVVPSGITLPTSGVHIYARDGYKTISGYTAGDSEAIATYDALAYNFDTNEYIVPTVSMDDTTFDETNLEVGVYTPVTVSASGASDVTKSLTINDEDLPSDGRPIIVAVDDYVNVDSSTGLYDTSSLTSTSFGASVYDSETNTSVDGAIAPVVIDSIIAPNGDDVTGDSVRPGVYDVTLSSTYTNGAGAPDNEEVILYVLEDGVTLPLANDYIYADKYHEVAKGTSKTTDEIISMYNAFALVASPLANDDIVSVEITKQGGTIVSPISGVYTFDEIGIFDVKFTSNSGQTITSKLIVTPTGSEVVDGEIYISSKPIITNVNVMNGATPIDLEDPASYEAEAYDTAANTMVSVDNVNVSMIPNSPYVADTYEVTLVAGTASKQEHIVILPGNEVLPTGKPSIVGNDLTVIADSTTHTYDTSGLDASDFGAYVVDMKMPDVLDSIAGQITITSIEDASGNTVTGNVAPGDYTVTLHSVYEDVDSQMADDKTVTLHVLDAMITMSGTDAIVAVGTSLSSIDESTFNAIATSPSGDPITYNVDLSSVPNDGTNVTTVGVYDVTITATDGTYSGSIDVKLVVVPSGITLPTSGVHIYARDGYKTISGYTAGDSEAIATYDAMAYNFDTNEYVVPTVSMDDTTFDETNLEVGVYTPVTVSASGASDVIKSLTINDEDLPSDGRPIIVAVDDYVNVDSSTGLYDTSSLTNADFNASVYDSETNASIDGAVAPVVVDSITDSNGVDVTGASVEAGVYDVVLSSTYANGAGVADNKEVMLHVVRNPEEIIDSSTTFSKSAEVIGDNDYVSVGDSIRYTLTLDNSNSSKYYEDVVISDELADANLDSSDINDVVVYKDGIDITSNVVIDLSDGIRVEVGDVYAGEIVEVKFEIAVNEVKEINDTIENEAVMSIGLDSKASNEVEVLFDSDGDGVVGDKDVCKAGDDRLDKDGDGVPDSCDDVDDSQAIAVTGMSIIVILMIMLILVVLVYASRRAKR